MRAIIVVKFCLLITSVVCQDLTAFLASLNGQNIVGTNGQLANTNGQLTTQTGTFNNGLTNPNQLALANNAFQTANQQAVQAQITAAQTQNLQEQQLAAQVAANLAAAEEAAKQARERARTQSETVRQLREELQRQAAEEAAQEAARTRTAALQAIQNAQQAVKEAREVGANSMIVFRGQFPGRCAGPGMYYHDSNSYYLCDSLHFHLYRCPEGFQVGSLNSYALGHEYTGKSYCNVPIKKAVNTTKKAVKKAAVVKKNVRKPSVTGKYRRDRYDDRGRYRGPGRVVPIRPRDRYHRGFDRHPGGPRHFGPRDYGYGHPGHFHGPSHPGPHPHHLFYW